MLVNTFDDLKAIGTNLSGTYALGRDITAGNMTPIGTVSTPFIGTLAGQNYTISNAIITATGNQDNNIGLFAAIGRVSTVDNLGNVLTTVGNVRNLNLTNFQVSANANVTLAGQFIGTLAGSNAGTITNVTATGTVNGGSLQGVIAGGLVGQNGMLFVNNTSQTSGIIDSSHATVAVT